MRRWLLLICSLACAPAVRAQAVRGVAIDSATRQPIPGVVISLLDSSRALLGRIITDDRGRFHLPDANAIRRLRVQRIGFRPREVALPRSATEIAIALESLPTLLAPVAVVENPLCPVRRDRVAVFALLEQARAGLLATVVARTANPAAMRVLMFERTFDAGGDRIAHQRVRFDSAVSAASFGASRSPGRFLVSGFTRLGRDSTEYYAPDSDVLLSDAFAQGYCFQIASSRDRAGQVGLSFAPARRNRNIVQIDGTLWIDTSARALRDLEYRYRELPRGADDVRPGGRISFVEARPGVVLIDRWSMRLPRARTDTVYVISNGQPITRVSFEPVETGGELAQATWQDSTTWRGKLGTLRGTAFNHDTLVRDITVRLDDTDYSARVDGQGRFTVGELLPGPYALQVANPLLDVVELAFDPSLRFIAERDSTITARIEAPTLVDYVFETCVSARNLGPNSPPFHLIAGRVLAAGAAPVNRAEVKAKFFASPDYFASIRTGTNGRFEICIPAAAKEMVTINVRAPYAEPRLITLWTKEVFIPLPIIIDRPQPPAH